MVNVLETVKETQTFTTHYM